MFRRGPIEQISTLPFFLCGRETQENRIFNAIPSQWPRGAGLVLFPLPPSVPIFWRINLPTQRARSLWTVPPFPLSGRKSLDTPRRLPAAFLTFPPSGSGKKSRHFFTRYEFSVCPFLPPPLFGISALSAIDANFFGQCPFLGFLLSFSF